ncbi:MAG: L-alanine-DL-glutamate epimerase [Gemmatimonadetes bacterium]|jgi:L-alanine-DL-glutamate epimerase-like enolase superfamily enzyme|nr:L-alanine-DL-glutamate epimerase [Gemmatimonadota bacterium]MBT6147805.1 L-alanine-DL-glutamate epimerase [Gemmatimonadota bacterium]MBT7859818.1 L-alanine-DL-glutamate epimerase [Gemmatimonadota bacterium]
MQIDHTDLEIQREPFARPFAFKGAAFHEKWNLVVRLRDDDGREAFGVGGLAVLWSDARVFARHSEVGGNALMVAILERGLALARSAGTIDSPVQLLNTILPDVESYAQSVTGVPDLSRTFILNALVALDNAAWMLWSQSRSVQGFDGLIPTGIRHALGHRQRQIALAPAIGYNMPDEQIRALLGAGAGILKVKIGHPGDEEEMVAGDIDGLARLHRIVGDTACALTTDGRVAYYLDANGRYRRREALERLLEAVHRIGLLDRILLLEEPFAADVVEDVDVRGLPVRVAADESLHDPADVERRHELGYGAVAIKPAGKTLSVAFDMVAEAHKSGMTAFVADNACVPWLLEWNKNVAARLPDFPGVCGGLIESNGAENYGRWQQMLEEHPCAGAPWLAAREGAYHLDDDYWQQSGGIFLDPAPYSRLLRPA